MSDGHRVPIPEPVRWSGPLTSGFHIARTVRVTLAQMGADISATTAFGRAVYGKNGGGRMDRARLLQRLLLQGDYAPRQRRSVADYAFNPTALRLSASFHHLSLAPDGLVQNLLQFFTDYWI